MLAMAQKLHDEYVQAGEEARDRLIDEGKAKAETHRRAGREGRPRAHARTLRLSARTLSAALTTCVASSATTAVTCATTSRTCWATWSTTRPRRALAQWGRRPPIESPSPSGRIRSLRRARRPTSPDVDDSAPNEATSPLHGARQRLQTTARQPHPVRTHLQRLSRRWARSPMRTSGSTVAPEPSGRPQPVCDARARRTADPELPRRRAQGGFPRSAQQRTTSPDDNPTDAPRWNF